MILFRPQSAIFFVVAEILLDFAALWVGSLGIDRKKRRRREKRGCVGPQWAGATQAPQVSFSTSPISAF